MLDLDKPISHLSLYADASPCLELLLEHPSANPSGESFINHPTNISQI